MSDRHRKQGGNKAVRHEKKPCDISWGKFDTFFGIFLKILREILETFFVINHEI